MNKATISPETITISQHCFYCNAETQWVGFANVKNVLAQTFICCEGCGLGDVATL